jgi:putative transposase
VVLKLLTALTSTIISSLKSRHDLALENLALRQQLAVLNRERPRPRLTTGACLFWVWLSRTWHDWASALVIVKPATVIRWHRKGFKLFWTWRSRRRRPGRPKIDPEIRDLILRMAEANPTWGAPRIHGELLKLGIEVSQRTVGRLMPRRRAPP